MSAEGEAPGDRRGTPDRGVWPEMTFDGLADLVVVIDTAGDVRYANPFTEQLLGREPGTVVGHNMSEFLHPDDLERALRLMGVVIEHDVGVTLSPAIYRIERADGSWCPVEINASLLADDEWEPGVAGAAGGPGVLIAVVGRYSGDRDLQDQIMGRLTEGEPATEVIGLIPEFGRWRHPLDHYAVFYRDEDGVPRSAGSAVATAFDDVAGATAPWVLAASTGEEVVVGLDQLAPVLRAEAEAEGLVECWAVPVPDPLHESPAVIVAWARGDAPSMEVHRYALQTMDRNLALVLQWRQQVVSLQRAARQDPLTGLANRTGFWEVLEAMGDHADEPRVGVLYIDLDGFKNVNDLHGHRVGDAVLAEVARRISAVLRPGDVVARLGGDEFAVLCPRITDDGAAVAIAERVVAAIDRPYAFDGLSLAVGASVGIATGVPGDLDADDLLDSADRALYRAKGGGRGGWHLEPSLA